MKVTSWSQIPLRLVQRGPRPKSVLPPIRRLLRDAWLLMRTNDQLSYYRAVMRSDAARGSEVAVGSPTHESWLRIGQLQFDYLLDHGLKPGDRMLEIGCGGLRAGRLFIQYLDPGHYYGVDLSPEILHAALQNVVRYRLQAKAPYLTTVSDLTLDFLPDAHFNVIHAHAVLQHCTLETIDRCLAGVRRVLAPGGFFDFTFDRVDGPEYHVLWEDFYYKTETLENAAARNGLAASLMKDWETLPHRQSKLRITAA